MLRTEILKLIRARAVGPTTLEIVFNDGSRKVVDLTPLLFGPVFVPLRDPDFFARAELDPVCGTVVWPNGADLAPEALFELPPVEATPA